MMYSEEQIQAACWRLDPRSYPWPELKEALENPVLAENTDPIGTVRGGRGLSYIKTGESNWAFITHDQGDEHYGDRKVSDLPVIPYLPSGRIVLDKSRDRWIQVAPDRWLLAPSDMSEEPWTQAEAVSDYIQARASGNELYGESTAYLIATWGPLTDVKDW